MTSTKRPTVSITYCGPEPVVARSLIEDLFAPSAIRSSCKPECSLQGKVETIYNILIGSLRTYRNGRAPSPAGRAIISKRIQCAIESGTPIEGFALWSGDKLYGMAESGADIADVLAFRRIVRLNNSIKQMHPPGLLFRIVQENLSAQFDGTTKDNCDRYATDYRALARMLAPDCVLVQSEEEIFQKLGVSSADFVHAANANYLLFREYWRDSEANGIESFETLQTYKKLNSQGWVGSIPRSLREHFKRRLQSNGVTEQIDDILCRFFACVLLRYQTGNFFDGSVFDVEGRRLSPLRFSFAPHSPDVPHSLYEARISYRLMDKTAGKPYRMPPWACCGILQRQNDHSVEIDLVGLNRLKQIRTESQLCNITITGKAESLSFPIYFFAGRSSGDTGYCITHRFPRSAPTPPAN